MAYKNKLIHNPVTGQSIRFLQTSCDTEGQLLEMESSFAPQSVEPVPHYHPKQHETFVVLEGTLQVRLNGKIWTLRAGDQLEIPPRTVHSMWNAGNRKTVVNWKVQPALSTEYFLETGVGLARGGKVNAKGMPPVLQTALLARYYRHVFRIANPPYAVQKILFGLLSPFSKLAGYKAVYTEYID